MFRADAVGPDGRYQAVALKVARASAGPQGLADEADLMGMLDHPNLVKRLETGFTDGKPFIAMEFLSGGDLAQLFTAHLTQARPFPRALALHLAQEVLKGLASFHQARSRTGAALALVHGDISPSNILFSAEGEVKLGDFGVAQSGARDLGPRGTLPIGKLRYLPPERLYGDPASPRGDLFAVGVLLHEMILGSHPFLTNTLDHATLVTAMRQAKLKLPETGDRALEALLRRALTPEPKQRFQTAGELAGALLHYALDHGQQLSTAQVRAHLREVYGR